VIRTTDVIDGASAFTLFGCFKGPLHQFTETTWLGLVGVSAVNPGLQINAANNAFFHASSSLNEASLDGAKMAPAAMTVQVMNPGALQTTTGIAYIGRAKTVLDLMGDARSWTSIANELVAYSAPRLCSAGKLALRGVQVNAVPNNMSVLSDFVPRGTSIGGPQSWNEATFATDLEGLAPIFVYNPNNIPLQFLVTVEWRMRFDPLNPAYAGHTLHQPASEGTWARVIGEAESLGHGVEDIADVVEAGAAAFGAAALF
jgi:hypothetical protein